MTMEDETMNSYQSGLFEPVAKMGRISDPKQRLSPREIPHVRFHSSIQPLIDIPTLQKLYYPLEDSQTRPDEVPVVIPVKIRQLPFTTEQPIPEESSSVAEEADDPRGEGHSDDEGQGHSSQGEGRHHGNEDDDDGDRPSSDSDKEKEDGEKNHDVNGSHGDVNGETDDSLSDGQKEERRKRKAREEMRRLKKERRQRRLAKKRESQEDIPQEAVPQEAEAESIDDVVVPDREQEMHQVPENNEDRAKRRRDRRRNDSISTDNSSYSKLGRNMRAAPRTRSRTSSIEDGSTVSQTPSQRHQELLSQMEWQQENYVKSEELRKVAQQLINEAYMQQALSTCKHDVRTSWDGHSHDKHHPDTASQTTDASTLKKRNSQHRKHTAKHGTNQSTDKKKRTNHSQDNKSGKGEKRSHHHSKSNRSAPTSPVPVESSRCYSDVDGHSIKTAPVITQSIDHLFSKGTLSNVPKEYTRDGALRVQSGSRSQSRRSRRAKKHVSEPIMGAWDDKQDKHTPAVRRSTFGSRSLGEGRVSGLNRQDKDQLINSIQEELAAMSIPQWKT